VLLDGGIIRVGANGRSTYRPGASASRRGHRRSSVIYLRAQERQGRRLHAERGDDGGIPFLIDAHRRPRRQWVGDRGRGRYSISTVLVAIAIHISTPLDAGVGMPPVGGTGMGSLQSLGSV
jgi:hypothetical protein